MVAPGTRSPDKEATRRGRVASSILASGGSGMTLMGLWLGLRRSARLGRPVATLRHELVELDLVLGVPQAIKEIPELALLLLEPPQRLGAVVVKGAVAAG